MKRWLIIPNLPKNHPEIPGIYFGETDCLPGDLLYLEGNSSADVLSGRIAGTAQECWWIVDDDPLSLCLVMFFNLLSSKEPIIPHPESRETWKELLDKEGVASCWDTVWLSCLVLQHIWWRRCEIHECIWVDNNVRLNYCAGVSVKKPNAGRVSRTPHPMRLV